MRLSPAQWMCLKWSVSILEFMAFALCIYSWASSFKNVISPTVPSPHHPLDFQEVAGLPMSEGHHIKIYLACVTVGWLVLRLVNLWMIHRRGSASSATEFRLEKLREHLENSRATNNK